MSLYRISILTLFISISFSSIFSQDRIPTREEQVISTRLGYVNDLHDSLTGVDKMLINGEIYYPHQRNASNHPFFNQESWISGSLVIGNEHYENLLLRYDLVLDQVLLLHIKEGANAILLSNNNIREFRLENRSFEYLTHEKELISQDFEEGYYEIIYQGDTKLYARWKKERKINNGFVPDEFRQKVVLLLLKDGDAFKIKSDNALKEALLDQKNEIRKYMQQHNLHIKISSPEEVGEVFRYYDTLKNRRE